MAKYEPADPFAAARRTSGVLRCPIADEDILMLLRQADIRNATSDYATYSSDAPCRVPIPSEEDVRSVRQLPIETDPPQHRDYRKLVLQTFTRPNNPAVAGRVRTLVREALSECLQVEQVEAVSELALPLQCRALTVLLNLPLTEAEEWISWGTPTSGNVDCGTVNAYVERRLDRAVGRTDEDFFGILSRATFHGRPLTREEMVGFANLTFAGGRDTIINLIANILDWLASNPAALDAMRSQRSLINSATEEFVRYFSPLPQVGRVLTRDLDINGSSLKAGSRVALCWASANRDEAIFDEADSVRLDRHPNPHVGFGEGHHACLGAQHARVLIRQLLRCLTEQVARIDRVSAEPRLERFGDIERQAGFARLELSFQPR